MKFSQPKACAALLLGSACFGSGRYYEHVRADPQLNSSKAGASQSELPTAKIPSEKERSSDLSDASFPGQPTL